MSEGVEWPSNEDDNEGMYDDQTVVGLIRKENKLKGKSCLRMRKLIKRKKLQVK